VGKETATLSAQPRVEAQRRRRGQGREKTFWTIGDGQGEKGLASESESELGREVEKASKGEQRARSRTREGREYALKMKRG